MTGERTDPPRADEPLGTTDPTWRDEVPATESPRPADDDDAELTIDADADLVEYVRAAARSAPRGPGRAAHPAAATADEPDTAAAAPVEPPTATGGDQWSPPPPGGATSSILPSNEPGPLVPTRVAPPTTSVAPPRPEPAPVAPMETAAMASAVNDTVATGSSGGRWRRPLPTSG